MQANKFIQQMKTGDTTPKIFQSVWVGCVVVRKDWKGNGGFKRKKCQIKKDQINLLIITKDNIQFFLFFQFRTVYNQANKQ